MDFDITVSRKPEECGGFFVIAVDIELAELETLVLLQRSRFRGHRQTDGLVLDVELLKRL